MSESAAAEARCVHMRMRDIACVSPVCRAHVLFEGVRKQLATRAALTSREQGKSAAVAEPPDRGHSGRGRQRRRTPRTRAHSHGGACGTCGWRCWFRCRERWWWLCAPRCLCNMRRAARPSPHPVLVARSRRCPSPARQTWKPGSTRCGGTTQCQHSTIWRDRGDASAGGGVRELTRGGV